MPYKDPEERRAYNKTASGKKQPEYLNLTIDKKTTHSTRVVDHDHNINERENVRAICCHACNSNDRMDNTSGEPNIYYHKQNDCWQFEKKIQGKYYSKSGFKTKQEAIDYKFEFLANL